MTDTAVPNLLPPIPRPVTRRASWRAWAEPAVQVWWKSALVVAIVMIYVTTLQVRQHLVRNKLLEHGIPVKAQIVYLNYRRLEQGAYQARRDIELPTTLKQVEGTMPNGQPFEWSGMLPKTEGLAHLGSFMDLRVDPADYTHWVEVGQTRTLADEFTAMFLLLPVVILLLGIAQWQRVRALRVWRSGKLREAVVVDCRHSATAPRSRVCRYTFADGDDRRVFHTLYPTKYGVPQRGDVLHMIVAPDRPNSGIIADFYIRQITR
jgi:hypothetical protein